ncbi:MAG TPA: asparagine synthase (glutamine-hydrolyzing), partial [Elusimicrobiota bacterium]|nr:asparagine synthase (glutamine-hydrolyzing) [Elusimicrobiota bacterium]
MCAIAGQYSFTGRPADRRLVRAMARRMGLRGPDGEGFHFHGRTGLAHKRLSILDLETGGQPMRHPSGRFTVVCNGEIYNYLELREELEAQGHRFETRSDTEVILHLYERYGAGCLERLEGMFAFCLYDQRKDALLLARDPFGVKPLHYYHDSAAFLFSSELKGLFAYAGLDRSVDGEALRQYFNFLYVLEPGCIFKNVRKVPPGHYLWVDRGGVRLRRYYDPKFFSEGARRPEGPGELREALAESVRLALRSDVPLGLFLSGGIDSSAVAALAARERPRMDSFSVAFRESPYDERRFSRMVAA